MADTVDPAVSLSPADAAEEPQDTRAAEESEERDDARSVTELLEQLGRELGDLGVSEAQLEAARNMPEVRRAVRDIAGALVLVIAALTAFAFLNVAAVDGLSTVVAPGPAALVLAAAWMVVGAVLLFGFMARARRWLSWIVLRGAPSQAVEELERERDAAIVAARGTLERLGPAIAIEIAVAAVPKAGDVAGGIIDAGDNVLDASDETVEAFAEQLPGGSVVNPVWDVVLMPGRLGIRVATSVLGRGRSPD